MVSQKYELPNMGGNTITTKITSQLIMELRRGEFSEETRLPSEVELSEHFGVSRSVIRDVLSNLEGEGFVERGRGIGTIIHREIVNLKNRLDLKYEYNRLISDAGYEPATDCVKMYEQAADTPLAARLQMEEGQRVIVCEKRLLASGTPVIYSIDHLQADFFQGIDYRLLDWSVPIFDLLEEHCGIVVDTDIANIEAVLGTPHVREKLQLQEGEAIFAIDEIGYYKLSRPILQTYGYYTNLFHFSLLRKKF